MTFSSRDSTKLFSTLVELFALDITQRPKTNGTPNNPWCTVYKYDDIIKRYEEADKNIIFFC